jgi:hypothetical protein
MNTEVKKVYPKQMADLTDHLLQIISNINPNSLQDVQDSILKIISYLNIKLDVLDVLDVLDIKNCSVQNNILNIITIKNSSVKDSLLNIISRLSVKKRKNTLHYAKRIFSKIYKIYKRQLQDIRGEILLWFSYIKNDQEFITLDQAFVAEGNEVNYNNLVNYLITKQKDLKVPQPWSVSLSIISDDNLPMYNEKDKKRNTYDNFIKGNILLNDRDSYIIATKCTQQGFAEKIYPFKGMLLNEKVGSQLAEQVESGAIGLAAALGFIGLLLIWASYYAPGAVSFLGTFDLAGDEVAFTYGWFILIIAVLFAIVAIAVSQQNN